MVAPSQTNTTSQSTPTPQPSARPTPQPIPQPTSQPTQNTQSTSAAPTATSQSQTASQSTPNPQPSAQPTPNPQPSAQPTPQPTSQSQTASQSTPNPQASAKPTPNSQPSAQPTPQPTSQPTQNAQSTPALTSQSQTDNPQTQKLNPVSTVPPSSTSQPTPTSNPFTQPQNTSSQNNQAVSSQPNTTSTQAKPTFSQPTSSTLAPSTSQPTSTPSQASSNQNVSSQPNTVSSPAQTKPASSQPVASQPTTTPSSSQANPATSASSPQAQHSPAGTRANAAHDDAFQSNLTGLLKTQSAPASKANKELGIGADGLPVLSRRVFSKYDKEKTGEINRDDFYGLCYDCGYCLSQDELTVGLALIDRDGNGKISYKEFSKFWQEDERFAHLKMKNEDVQWLLQAVSHYKHFDKNHDGVLQLDEFRNVYDDLKRYGAATKSFEAVVAELDDGETGTVSFNQYVQWQKKPLKER